MNNGHQIDVVFPLPGTTMTDGILVGGSYFCNIRTSNLPHHIPRTIL
jgi:hypothetical protein